MSVSIIADPLVLPDGIRHFNTNATAETWDAWDRLTPELGWEHREWTTEEGRRHRQKTGRINGMNVTVFPPLEAEVSA